MINQEATDNNKLNAEEIKAQSLNIPVEEITFEQIKTIFYETIENPAKLDGEQ